MSITNSQSESQWSLLLSPTDIQLALATYS